MIFKKITRYADHAKQVCQNAKESFLTKRRSAEQGLGQSLADVESMAIRAFYLANPNLSAGSKMD